MKLLILRGVLQYIMFDVRKLQLIIAGESWLPLLSLGVRRNGATSVCLPESLQSSDDPLSNGHLQ